MRIEVHENKRVKAQADFDSTVAALTKVRQSQEEKREEYNKKSKEVHDAIKAMYKIEGGDSVSEQLEQIQSAIKTLEKISAKKHGEYLTTCSRLLRIRAFFLDLPRNTQIPPRVNVPNTYP